MAREDLDLGPCAVYLGTHPNEANLGRTEGGVRVAFATDVADLMSDQWGTQPEDGVITGQGARITVPLAEYTLTNLGIALHQSLIGDGLIEGVRLVGTKMRSLAESLLLKKYVDGVVSANEEDWIRFPVAAAAANPEILFDKSTQRIIEVEFIAYPDSDDILYFIGEEGSS